jgi:hypothetical protein
MLTAVMTSGVLLGRLFFGEPAALLAWGLSIFFIPTLALTLGIWSDSSKVFEVVYPILWYLGPMNPQNGLTLLDYLGIHSQAPVNTSPLAAAAVIFLLMGAALLGLKRKMGA